MRELLNILRTGKSLRKSYLLVSFFTVLLSLLTIVQPLLSGWAIDEIGKGSQADVTYAALLALAIFGLDLSQTIFSNISGHIGDQIQVKLQKILSENYFSHLLKLPQAYYDEQQSGTIIARLNRSIEQIVRFIHLMTNNFLQFIFSTVFSLVVVTIISWQVGLLLLSLYPIFIWMTVRSSGAWLKYQEKKNFHMDAAGGRFAEAVGQVKVVKSYGQEQHELRFFQRHLSKVIQYDKPQSKYWHFRDTQRRLILNVIFFAVYAFIFIRGAQGVFTPGEAVALILYAMNIRIPIFTISFLVQNTQRAVADSKDYFEIMDELPEADDAGKPLALRNADIVFHDVTFGYPGGKKVLKNVSFDIRNGEKVALVGESGEGKTTLTNLLLRLYDPSKGIIQIDSQQTTEVTRASLREQISVVFQEPNLFSGTIKENIRYANPSASDKDIEKAALAANAHSFIIDLQDGYETQIGERGLKLSGGQKQRIAIARAILKDAPILVLDEATSSLDSKSELMVQEALERLMKGRTTIIIAHRLSTIQSVDKIVALKNGKVAEIGSPQELAKANGIYAQLLKVQTARSADERQEALAKFGIVG